jgi:hypothetical protein
LNGFAQHGYVLLLQGNLMVQSKRSAINYQPLVCPLPNYRQGSNISLSSVLIATF